ncbi:hypothetical protein HN858_00025 [Candidatus Falkowbacteria bacterium]|jgi:hypothetical protein|nr:hypothetical protein [Candidatus Falkowbacteria bacterium]MBT5502722.1 hypothetical protein [Candidatus Falkowbacteria bacterium]MBT6573494.1 hypothetical protein [Candidatus Falkowbacteria bacterium]MBT7348044.1 hypothetical protein [Candidatus Falkowbacteria bacterium]MBT7501121.1 hypothetical protein [Candidatus Falkowbacteria bacterium]
MLSNLSRILIILVMLCIASPTLAQSAFIQIGDIQGEAEDVNHDTTIEVMEAENISGSTEGGALPTEEIVLPAEYDDLVIEEIVSEEAIIDNEVTVEDLEVNANVQTTSRWRRWWQNTKQAISLATTFDAAKAAEKRFTYANQKVARAKYVIENSDNEKLKAKAVKDIEKAQEYVTYIKNKITSFDIDPEKLKNLQDKFTHQQYLHHKILEKLENQVTNKAYEKIKATRERHLENMKEVMEKVDNNDPEKVAERLRKIFEAKQGSNLKPLNDLEFIDKLKDKFGDNKKAFDIAIAERHRKLGEKMEKIDVRERAAKVKNYMAHVQAKNDELKEKLLERRHKILDQAGKAKELSSKLKSTISTAKNDARRRIEKAKILKAKKLELTTKAESGDVAADELLRKINEKKDLMKDNQKRKVHEIRKEKQMLPAYDETKWDPQKKEVKPTVEAKFNPKEINAPKTEPYDQGGSTISDSPNKEFTNDGSSSVFPKVDIKVQPVQQGPGLIKIKPKVKVAPKKQLNDTN